MPDKPIPPVTEDQEFRLAKSIDGVEVTTDQLTPEQARNFVQTARHMIDHLTREFDLGQGSREDPSPPKLYDPKADQIADDILAALKDSEDYNSEGHRDAALRAALVEAAQRGIGN